jgi:ribosomal protein L14E/L6E/L27E
MAKVPADGDLVRSRRGRDRDQLFLVVGHSELRCLIADGRLHPVERPKPKNARHLEVVDATTERLQEWRAKSYRPDDHELTRELEAIEAQVSGRGGAEDAQGGHDRGGGASG